MHSTTILSTLALAALSIHTLAQGLDSEDIAPNCSSQCSAIVTASDACERQYDDVPNEDQQELDCICNSQGLSTAIPECEACQRQYYAQDDDYNDIRELLQRCGFSSISASGSGGMTMTGMGAAPTGGSTTIITSTYTDRDDDDDDDDIDLEVTTITSVLPTDAPTSTTANGGAGGAGASTTDAAGSAASSGTEAVGSPTDAAGQAADEQTGNFAPARTAAPVLAVAGIAAAVFGL